ncbi:MAG: succinyldiaminopimelate transaminase [Cellvibrionaceae bacterium]|nr:succinyldiaminopimelate transaminase [Cellvibrionaceae bacterium]
MNSELQNLQPYPFQRLAQLKKGLAPPLNLKHIPLSIGEPKHAPPQFVLNVLTNHIGRSAHYPTTQGIVALREAIAKWAIKRFKLAPGSLDANANVLPVNGTREALFSFAQCAIDRNKPSPKVMMPNPFYQIYEGAALLAGAQPVFLNCLEQNHFLPNYEDIDPATWKSCQMVYICNPGNPSGAVMNTSALKTLIKLADKYQFIIASDECYSELYFSESKPPPGLLQVCSELGRDDYHNCIVFHSLSKRSNLPGLRSGFVAGDRRLIKSFLQYRTYHGCAMPIPTQLASIAAWQDEKHVVENRNHYRKKFNAVLDILSDTLEVTMPDASFYLWPKTPIGEVEFCQRLFANQNITALPGSFLARDTATGNPGEKRMRLALVAPIKECVEAAHRIREFCVKF